ncbi:MAG: hypothetical protein R2834_11825 [Rhodothermales bacterium]
MKKTAIYQQKRSEAPGWINTWIQSPTWLLGAGVSLALCAVVYAANAMLGRLSPGSVWGLAYGIGAAVLLVALSLYGLRRKVVRLPRLQRVWYYLQFHVYGGVLFLVLMLMHTNFHVPRGVLTWWLWALSLWLVATGLIGSALQKWVPRLIQGGLSNEVQLQRIPELLEAIRKEGEALSTRGTERMQDLYRERIAGHLASLRPQLAYFIDPSGFIQRQSAFFDAMRRYLGGAELEQLDDLARLYRAKLELDAHYTLQRTLRVWLVFHVPVAMIVLGLVALHVATVFYY